jgi:hypothetical protein
MKDPLGHGSDAGTHAQGTVALPAKGDDWAKTMPDSAYHASMPIENYKSQIGDMLGMWNGSQKSEPLSADETKQVTDAYNLRASWRAVAGGIRAQRVSAKFHGGSSS